MEWWLDRNKALTKEVWSFEAAEALEIAAMANTWRKLGSPQRKMCLRSCIV